MQYEGKKLRHELKYFINYGDYLMLRGVLKRLLKLDENAGEDCDYFIRSLYFDDIINSALYEKNFGCFRREKYRIRIYDYSDSIIKLERKRKIGQYVCKESENITRTDYEALMAGCFDFLQTQKSQLKKEFFILMRSMVLRPKVIVDYDREAYIGNVSDLRITFDKDLRVAYGNNDIFDENIASKCIFDKNRMIMEVKFNEFLPENIRDLLNNLSSEHCAIPKYVFCRIQKNNI